eukprot:6049066-Amphidinium_carterae.1
MGGFRAPHPPDPTGAVKGVRGSDPSQGGQAFHCQDDVQSIKMVFDEFTCPVNDLTAGFGLKFAAIGQWMGCELG